MATPKRSKPDAETALTTSRQTAQGRVAAFDAIRGIAVLFVILRHAWPWLFGGGGVVGVAVFFTLSGYLITGVLHKDLVASGHIRLRLFYRNRALRLIPPLLLFLLGISFVEGALNLFGGRACVGDTVL